MCYVYLTDSMIYCIIIFTILIENLQAAVSMLYAVRARYPNQTRCLQRLNAHRFYQEGGDVLRGILFQNATRLHLAHPIVNRRTVMKKKPSVDALGF
jgi:hypothetical protein